MKAKRHVPILAAALCAIAPAAVAAVSETLKREPYAVTGTTEDEVRADINAKRNGNYDAMAKWDIRWRYQYRKTATGCAFESVSISLNLTMIEPSLRSPDPVLQKSFDDYLVKLRGHEDGHADIARATSRRIDEALRPMTAATCDDLGPRANETAHGLIGESNREQAAYDARTDHGATQGARWPHLLPPPDRSQYQTSAPPPRQLSSD